MTIDPLLARPDYNTLHSSGIADLVSRMGYLENIALSHGPFIDEDKLGVRDIHAIRGVRWDLHGGESQPPGLGNQTHPAVGKISSRRYGACLRICRYPIPKPKIIGFEEAKKKIFGAGYTSRLKEGVMQGEPTGVKAGTQVTVDSLKCAPQ